MLKPKTYSRRRSTTSLTRPEEPSENGNNKESRQQRSQAKTLIHKSSFKSDKSTENELEIENEVIVTEPKLLKTISIKDYLRMPLETEAELFKRHNKESFYSLHILYRCKSTQMTSSFHHGFVHSKQLHHVTAKKKQIPTTTKTSHKRRKGDVSIKE